MPIAYGTKLRLTTKNRAKPNVLKTALSTPGPIALSSTGTGEGGAPLVEACVAANRSRYWGFSFFNSVAAGDQVPDASGAIVEGFTGCTQGSPVYVADDGSLTHTAPVSSIAVTGGGGGTVDVPIQPIGLAVRTTAIYFFPR